MDRMNVIEHEIMVTERWIRIYERDGLPEHAERQRAKLPGLRRDLAASIEYREFCQRNTPHASGRAL